MFLCFKSKFYARYKQRQSNLSLDVSTGVYIMQNTMVGEWALREKMKIKGRKIKKGKEKRKKARKDLNCTFLGYKL